MLTIKEKPTSLLAEAYRGLRTSLEYSSVDKDVGFSLIVNILSLLT